MTEQVRVFTGFNEWTQEVAYATHGFVRFKHTDTQCLAIREGDKLPMGVWDNDSGDGTVGLKYKHQDGKFVGQQ